jgi:hypothetical protein
MTLVTRRGAEIPFFIEDFTYEDIQTVAFDPITLLHDARHVHPTVLNDSDLGAYTKHGFLVRPDTDGVIYGITWRQYKDNLKSLSGLVPQAYLASANTWIECPFVKIFAHNDGTYPSGSHYINVGQLV